jgi:hypothetical protein
MMPYQSDKQRRFMHAQHPEIAAKWDAEIREQKRKKRVKKNLTPVEPQFDMSNPDFNYKAARKMYDIVMKMDADEAVIFSEMLINDVLDETISKNLPTLQRHLDEVVSKRIEKIKKAALRTVSKGMTDNAREYAQAIRTLEEITKAQTPQDYGYVWREQDFRRDPRTGQFQTKVKHSQKKPIRESTAAAMGIGGMEDQRYKKLSPEQKAKYQDEYRQLQQFLSTVTASTGGQGNQEVLLHYRDRGGNRFVQRHSGGPEGAKDLLLDENTTLVGAVARPTALTAGGAAFGLVPALGERGVRGANAGEKGFSTFANDWYDAGSEDPSASNAKLYGRVGAGSKYLGDIAGATGNPKLLAAAKVGQFVGDHGAEAEQVFGPAARKTAYRYRGTEKTPDKSLVSAYAQGIRQAKSYNAQEQRTTRGGRGVTPAVSQMGRQRVSEDERAPSHDETLQGVYKIEEWFRSDKKRMPDPKLYRLQLASGNTPPSEGVLINRDGQIVSQAIGYGDDHYLPFNLKNLKGLKGGEYIRTRSVGGPTSEDIYTGLVAGARRITVISRSGTFTVTFEDDFRGGRRHNDKARRMTRRYEQILDAVQSEQVDRQAVPPEVRQLITDEVFAETEGWGIPRAEQNKMVRDRIEEYKSSPDLTEWDEKLLESQIKSVTAGAANEREAAKLKAQLIGNKMALKEFKFRLNGPGYEAALKSLEEQFPYYIKTDSKPQHDLESFSGNVDLGYVEPGRNRPTAASAGLFTAKNKAQFAGVQGKFSAAEADYQGYRGKAAAATAAAAAGKPANGEEEKPETSEAQEHSRKAEEIKRAIRLNRAAAKTQQVLNELIAAGKLTVGDEAKKTLQAPTSELVKPQNLAVLNRTVNGYVDAGGKLDPDVLREFRTAAGHMNRVEFDREALMWADEPNLFKGNAYKTEATFEERANEMMKRDAFSVRNEKRFSQMDEDEMAEEFEVLAALHAEYAAGGPVDGAMKQNAGAAKGAPGLNGLNKDTDVVNRMENLQRVRALKADMSDEDKEKLSGQMAAGPLLVERAPQTSEELAQTDPQKAADELMERAKKAAEVYMQSQDDEDQRAADELLNFVNDLREEKKGRFRTAEDYRNFMDDLDPDLRAKIYKPEPKKSDEGPTGTKRLPE